MLLACPKYGAPPHTHPARCVCTCVERITAMRSFITTSVLASLACPGTSLIHLSAPLAIQTATTHVATSAIHGAPSRERVGVLIGRVRRLARGGGGQEKEGQQGKGKSVLAHAASLPLLQGLPPQASRLPLQDRSLQCCVNAAVDELARPLLCLRSWLLEDALHCCGFLCVLMKVFLVQECPTGVAYCTAVQRPFLVVTVVPQLAALLAFLVPRTSSHRPGYAPDGTVYYFEVLPIAFPINTRLFH